MQKTITLFNKTYNNDEELLDFIENFNQIFAGKTYNVLDLDKSYKYLITITAIEE